MAFYHKAFVTKVVEADTSKTFGSCPRGEFSAGALALKRFKNSCI